MAWVKDIVGVDAVKYGTFRSLNGAADESIFQGRASKAGFYCFFKVWRDMPYDAVLDYNSILYRVEVKGSSKGKFDVTRGTRSGRQIDRTPGTSRTRILSREDCDFVVGVDSNTGDCYIIPQDIITIMGLDSVSTNIISAFKEKWGLFIFSRGNNILTASQTRDGLMGMSLLEVTDIATSLGITVSPEDIKIGRTKAIITGSKEKTIYQIWNTIAQRL